MSSPTPVDPGIGAGLWMLDLPQQWAEVNRSAFENLLAWQAMWVQGAFAAQAETARLLADAMGRSPTWWSDVAGWGSPAWWQRGAEQLA